MLILVVCMKYGLDDLEKKYGLELDRIVGEIKKIEAKSVLLQLPDGLKPWGPVLVDYISGSTYRHDSGEPKRDVQVRIWLGDCFGACDLPDSGCDLVVQFGHSEW